MNWNVLASAPVAKPAYLFLEKAYEDYRINPQPAGTRYSNQCAVRMSIALGRCGFLIDGFPEKNRIKSTPDLPVPYIVGAHELADYLQDIWGRPNIFRHELSHVPTSINGKTGIIYFNNCFHRKNDKAGRNKGDHIDLWNGTYYYNQLLHIRAGEEDSLSTGALFDSSDQIWLFELS